MAVEWLILADLDDVPARMARVKLDQEACDRYTDLLNTWLEAGQDPATLPLPPLSALREAGTGRVFVFDGAHRRLAAACAYAPLVTFPVDVVGEGTFAEARRLARRSNRDRGVPLSRADLNLQANAVLDEEEVAVLNGATPRTNTQLAEEVGCSHTHIANLWRRRQEEAARKAAQVDAQADPAPRPAPARGEQVTLPPATWPYQHLLGTMSDCDVATAAGVMPSEVVKRRRLAQIPSFVPPKPPEVSVVAAQVDAALVRADVVDLVGKLPDQEIASIISMDDTDVASWREAKGVAAHDAEDAVGEAIDALHRVVRPAHADPQPNDVFALRPDPQRRPTELFVVTGRRAARINGRQPEPELIHVLHLTAGGGREVGTIDPPYLVLNGFVLLQRAEPDPQYEGAWAPPSDGFDFSLPFGARCLRGWTHPPMELVPEGHSQVEKRLAEAERQNQLLRERIGELVDAASAKVGELVDAASAKEPESPTPGPYLYRYRDNEKVLVRTTTGDKIGEVFQDDEGDRLTVLLPAGLVPADDRAHLASTSSAHGGRHLWDVLRDTLVTDRTPEPSAEDHLFDPGSILPWQGTLTALKEALHGKSRPWLNSLHAHLHGEPLGGMAWKNPTRCIRKLAAAVEERSKHSLFDDVKAAS